MSKTITGGIATPTMSNALAVHPDEARAILGLKGADQTTI